MAQQSGTNAARLAFDTSTLPILSEWEVTSGAGQGDTYTWGGSAWVKTTSVGSTHVNLRDSSGTEITSLGNSITGIVQRGEVTKPLSGTRTTFFLLGATEVELTFMNTGSATYALAGATAREARIVFNAADDTDADAKALSAAERDIVPLNSMVVISAPSTNPITRMDVYSDAASEASGTTKLYWKAVTP